MVTAKVDTKDTDEKKIAMMMVGREVILEVNKDEFNPGDVIQMCIRDRYICG